MSKLKAKRGGSNPFQLRNARIALNETQRKLKVIMDHLNYDVVVPFNENGEITQWHAPAERLFGWSKFEIRGKKLADLLLADRERETFEHALSHFLQTREQPILGGRIKILACRKEGLGFVSALRVVAVRMGKGYDLFAIFTDLSNKIVPMEEIGFTQSRAA